MARKKQNNNLSSFDELIVPTVKALLDLGESGTVEEINTKVYEIVNIPDDILQIPHGDKCHTTGHFQKEAEKALTSSLQQHEERCFLNKYASSTHVQI